MRENKLTALDIASADKVPLKSRECCTDANVITASSIKYAQKNKKRILHF